MASEQFVNAMKRVSNLCISTLGDVVKPDLGVIAASQMTHPEIMQSIPEIAPPTQSESFKTTGKAPTNSDEYYEVTGGKPEDPEKGGEEIKVEAAGTGEKKKEPWES